VRTGQVTRFERHAEDPFAEEDRPSVVATSAPPLSASLAPTPRRHAILPPPDPYNDDERLDDRTKPVYAIRQSDIRELRRNARQAMPMSEPPTMRNPTPNKGLTPPPRRSDVAPRPGALPQKPAIRRRG
jgi:hypothetical protein